MNRHTILLVIVFVVFPALIVLLTVQARRRIRPYYVAIESLSKHFVGECSKVSKLIFNYPKFVGTFSGCKFSVTYLSNKASCVTGLEIICYITSSQKLNIFMYDKNPGPVLWAKRVNIGDRDFAGYYIYSNKPDEANRYFADDQKRKSIMQIHANGWLLPTITNRTIRLYAADVRPKPSLDPEMIKNTLSGMIALQVKHT